MKPNPICFTIQKFRFENEEERDFEKKRTDEIPYTNLCSLLDVTLSIRAFFFFFSLCLCSVCVIALFLYFRLSLFFFLFVCPPSIYRETPKEFFPYFSLNWSDHGAVFVSFSSTFPNSMLSHDPLFSFLLFLFVPLLFKLPLFGLWHPPLFRFSGPLSWNLAPYFQMLPLPIYFF